MKLIGCIFSILVCLNLSAQKETTNWVFGDSLLMTFTDTGIYCISAPSNIRHESSASISDSSGNIIFHTDGKFVWNKFHNLMTNGCCLNVDQYWTYASSVTQGIVIIPKPSEAPKYYIFTIANDTLSYSIVDMLLNGGLGDVIIQNQDVLFDTVMEKMHAVKHANGRDWWLLVHERIPSFSPGATNRFYKLLITPEGVQGPFEQYIGEPINYYTSWGEMLFSPDGSKLAITGYNFVEVFDFDRCTGELNKFANIDNFDPIVFDAYGLSFSPDGSKLYISSFDLLYQYCLNCKDSIEETKVLLFENPYGGYFIGQHELGPDGKIYFAIGYMIMPNNIFTYKNMNLCVINEPNLLGDLCNIDTSTIWLGGRRVIMGLPNMVNYSLGAIPGSECDTLGLNTPTIVDNTLFTVFPNPTSDKIYFNHPGLPHILHTITISNATGAVVFTAQQNHATEAIDLQSLPAGAYFYTIDTEGKTIQSGTIVKN